MRSARSSESGPVLIAPPTRSLPSSSLAASGCSVALVMSFTVIRPRSSSSPLITSTRSRRCLCISALASSRLAPFAHRDEPLARRHDLADWRVVTGLEAQVAVGDDADHALALDHGQARDLVRALQLDRVAHRHVLRDRDRVAQHARLVALDLEHLGGLLRGRHVLVHDADAAFLRERNREAGFGDGIHRRRHERDVQCDVPGEFCRQLHVAGKYRRVGGDEQHVIEGQRLLNQPHSCPHDAKAEYTRSTQALIGRTTSPFFHGPAPCPPGACRRRMDCPRRTTHDLSTPNPAPRGARHRHRCGRLRERRRRAMGLERRQRPDRLLGPPTTGERQVDADPPTAGRLPHRHRLPRPRRPAAQPRTATGRPPRPPPPVRPSRSPSATWNSASASRNAPTANARRRKSSRSRRRRRAECERARGYLRSLDDGVRISRTDASGNREYLDDAQRAAESERTRKAIQQLCN